MTEPAEQDQLKRLWWAAPAATGLVLLMLLILFGKEQKPPAHGTSYDASQRGFRAAYLVLEELDYPVARSKRPTSRGLRWVLFPTQETDTGGMLRTWVRNGGRLLLADDGKHGLGRSLGIDLATQTELDEPGDVSATGLDVTRIAIGRTFVYWKGQRGDERVHADGQPVVTVHPFGEGSVWLVNRPELLTNRLLREADNALLLTRLAEEMSDDGQDEIVFDEYCHGMRDRPDVLELLVTPPTVWVTLQGLFVLGLLLWHAMPRFGSLQRPSPPSRRSKQEFLDAMAALLERKRDYGDAYRTVRDGLTRDLETALGLPLGTPLEQLVRAASQRRSIQADRLRRLLSAEGPPGGPGGAAFVQSLNDLESARHDCFHA